MNRGGGGSRWRRTTRARSTPGLSARDLRRDLVRPQPRRVIVDHATRSISSSAPVRVDELASSPP